MLRIHRSTCAASLLCALQLLTSPIHAQNGNLPGFADLHNHQFANLAFGGRLIVGSPAGPIESLNPLTDLERHGPGHTADIMGGLMARRGPGVLWYPNTGYPTFDGWPNFNEVAHQKTHQEWLHRALQGGMRLMVMMAVDSPLLCQSLEAMAVAGWQLTGTDGRDCTDEMASIDLQLDAAYAMQDAIDQQAGGPGRGWYRIVTTPAQARQAVQQGKLAVVLGIETAHLFNCKKEPCDWQTPLRKYWAKGVRHFFPIHQDNNAFGGAAYFQSMIQRQTNWLTDQWSQLIPFVQPYDLTTRPCPEYEMGAFGIGSLQLWPGRCNTSGLTSTGRAFIRELMQRGAIIDIDHMSDRSVSETLLLAEEARYPGIVASHAGFNEIDHGDQNHEGQMTASELKRVQDLGGMVAIITGQGGLSDVRTYVRPGKNTIEQVCGGSSETLAQAYYYALDHAPGMPIALGTDFNGPVIQSSPRFGENQCFAFGLASNRDWSKAKSEQLLSYPFLARGSGQRLDKYQSGSYVYDFNYDGLRHVGLLPDLLADLEALGMSPEELEPMFRSAEGYIRMWERAQPAQPSLLEFSRDASGVWQAADISAELDGVRLDGNPRAVLTGGDMHVYARRFDGHLVEFYSAPGRAWQVFDLSAATNGPIIAGDPRPMMAGGDMHVYARSVDGHLLEFYLTPNKPWQVFDLSASPQGTTIAGEPVPVLTGPDVHIYVRGNGGGFSGALFGPLLEFYKAPNRPWQVFDQSVATNSAPIAGNPAPMPAGPDMHVYARSFDGRLIEFYLAPGKPWQVFDLSAATQGTRITGDPAPVLTGSDVHVYVRGPGAGVTGPLFGPLLEFYKSPNTAWQVFDQSAATNGTLIEGEPMPAPSGPDMHVYARRFDGHLVDFYLAPAKAWQIVDVSAAANNVPVGGSPVAVWVNDSTVRVYAWGFRPK